MATKKNLQGYTDIYEQIPELKRPVAEKLILDLVFMDKLLSELRDIVAEQGGVEQFKQGKQEFMRESPALKSYNNTIKQRNATYTQLLGMIPKTEVKADEESDGFEAFLAAKER